MSETVSCYLSQKPITVIYNLTVIFFEETGTLVIHVVGSIYVYVQVVVPIQCHTLGSNSASDAYITKS